MIIMIIMKSIFDITLGSGFDNFKKKVFNV